MFPPHTNWIREPVARLRATTVGIGYVITLVFKEVPVAGTLLAVQSFAAGITTPLIVWAISELIDALPRSLRRLRPTFGLSIHPLVAGATCGIWHPQPRWRSWGLSESVKRDCVSALPYSKWCVRKAVSLPLSVFRTGRVLHQAGGGRQRGWE